MKKEPTSPTTTNRFATMLHRNSHKMTVILVYTILEWILISLLLLNALFSYFITKFASYFGLRPPCLLCSRVDDLFEPPRGLKLFPDLICEDHVAEISMLGYCPSHRAFPEGTGLCRACSDDHCRAKAGKELEEETACGIVLEAQSDKDDDLVVKVRSLGDLGGTHKEDSVQSERDEAASDAGDELEKNKEDKKEKEKEKEEEEEDSGDEVLKVREVDHEHADADSVAPTQSSETYRRVHGADAYIRILNQCRGCGIVMGEKLVSVELVDLNSGEVRMPLSMKDMDVRGMGDNLVVSPLDEVALKSIVENEDGGKFSVDVPLVVGDDGLIGDEGIIGVDVGDGVVAVEEEVKGVQVTCEATEEDEKTDGEISIGSEICDREHVQPSPPEFVQTDNASREEIKAIVEGNHELPLDRDLSSALEIESNHSHASHEENESEEEKVDTPTSTDGVRVDIFDGAIHRDFGTDSTDSGSVASEVESPETLTIDQLKESLQEKQKALSALYAELEEERTAAAIATNQTMAMITRLQEEKAAMQMEALQYQRMIEEQTEYDQEEWQMLNELVMTKENEKMELEKELEMYRAKVLEYESKVGVIENFDFHGVPSTIDEGVELGEDEGDMYGHDDQYIAADLGLDSTAEQQQPQQQQQPSNAQSNDAEKLLDNFENDRVSILEQLKSLEKKIRSLKMSEKSKDQETEDDKQDAVAHDGNGETHDDHSPNGKVTTENGEGKLEGEGNAFDDLDSKLDQDENPLTIDEELDDMYRRLQDLEDDRDFIKLCITFLKNGDRCINLLEEILQQLRESRTAELGMGNGANILIAASA